MFGILGPHHFRPPQARDSNYLKDLSNSTGGEAVICYDQQCEEGEQCCHTMDFGIAYCCSQVSGLVYLGVMVGGGLVIALLVICCYVVLRGKEKQLEAAAQLEAAKAVSTAMSSAHDAIQLAGEANAHNSSNTDDLNIPPPSYGEVVQTLQLQRCHSYDVATMASNARHDDHDVVTSAVGRQLSEGSNVPYPIASASGLPPLPPCHTLESKLPTYEQCTSAVGEISATGAIAQTCRRSVTNNNNNNNKSSEDRSSSSSSTSKFYFSSTCGVTNVTTPEPEMEEVELPTPTEVDDDTGIVRGRQDVADGVRLANESEDKLMTDNTSSNSVRCRLEFRWNANDQTEIAIGYKQQLDDNGHEDESESESTGDCNKNDNDGGDVIRSNHPRLGLNLDQSENVTTSTTPCEAATEAPAVGPSSDSQKTQGQRENGAQSTDSCPGSDSQKTQGQRENGAQSTDSCPGSDFQKTDDHRENGAQSTDSCLGSDSQKTQGQRENGAQSTDSCPGSDSQKTQGQRENGAQSTDSCPSSDFQKTESQRENGAQSTDSCPGSDFQKTDDQRENGAQSTDSCPGSDFQKTDDQRENGAQSTDSCPGSDSQKTQGQRENGAQSTDSCPGSDSQKTDDQRENGAQSTDSCPGSDSQKTQGQRENGAQSTDSCPGSDFQKTQGQRENGAQSTDSCPGSDFQKTDDQRENGAQSTDSCSDECRENRSGR